MGTKRKNPSKKEIVSIEVKCPNCQGLRQMETNKYHAQELLVTGSLCKECRTKAYKGPRAKRLTQLTDPSESIKRFWSLGVVVGDCLIYRPEQTYRYGEYNHSGTMEPAHRLAYKFTFGDLPEDATIEQHCGNDRCIKPEHLKLVTDEIRFWERVDKSAGEDACWPWQGSQDGNGYGNLMWKLEFEGAHRIAYLLDKGNLPSGLCVCHTCDFRLCCNPKHLWLGTGTENIKDMYEKGRAFSTQPQMFVGARKLEGKEEELRILREGGLTQQKLGEHFVVGIQVIRRELKRLGLT